MSTLQTYDTDLRKIRKKLVEESQKRQMDEQKKKIFEESVEKIPNDKWRIVFKLQADGYAIKEISEIMGLPDGTVKTYLRRTKEFLKEVLQEYAI